jgi:hypothetical protein
MPARAKPQMGLGSARAREVHLTPNGSEQLLVSVDSRAAELENCRIPLGSPNKLGNRFRDVFYIDRLQPGQAAAKHRIDRKLPKELQDGGEKRVIRSEHHRRTNQKCVVERGPDHQFAFAPHSDVPRW